MVSIRTVANLLSRHPHRFEACTDSVPCACGARQYMMFIRTVAVQNLLSRVGLSKAVQWPNLRNVQTDKVRKSYTNTELVEVRWK